MYVQDVLQTLNQFWVSRGCLLWTPYHTEVGAGTSNPATFLRVLGPEPWWVAYTEPSIRPTDGRYGENPNRLQHYFQYQVILKPSPPDVQELFLQSLEALGLDLTKHDFRFVEDNWQSPSLGAWGLGWEAWLDGMEILQFTYFQECGGIKLDVRACELTYGIERIAMYLQGVESVYDLKWAPSGISYGDIFHAQEVEYCKYNFDAADTEKLFQAFDMWEAEGQQLLDKDLVLPAYDHCLRLSHLFNVLDARGAFSVSERGRFLLRCRKIAEQCAKGYLAQREEMEFPLRRFPYPGKDDVGTPVDADISAKKDSDTLLLEIGVEELPHGDVKTVERHVPKFIDKFFAEAGLEHGAVTTWITPRRIAFRIEDVPPRQEDVTKEARGPKKDVAKDKDDNWTIPAQKFAEANGATVDDIYFAQQGKFEYCFVKALQKGKGLDELLSGILPKLLRAIPFGKSMGWQDSTVTFSRPVRWLLALHGDQVVPLSWTLREEDQIGPERRIYADRLTYGHRRLGVSGLSLAKADDYVATLREGLVCVDRAERETMLREGVQALADKHGLVPEDDPELFDEIVDLCEWPEPVVGAIPEDALVLPESIIITPMKVHQRYIPLREKDGSLSKHFICVANGQHDADGIDLIRAGNECVVNARLRDAKYFWDTDTKQPLSKFAEGLSRVTFHQKLGSVADKIERLRSLYAVLKDQLPAVDDDKIEQILSLMKADLTTQMVFEFDSLEGVVGKLYAEKERLDQDVADAILEHRLPRRADDQLPAGALGIVAGVLDRIDTLAGYFGIGVRVKGTSDPFGLRRNALALLAIASASDLDLNLNDFFKASLETYAHALHDGDKALRDILDFFKDRQDVMARDEGFPYDQVAAALSCHADQPLQLRRCLDALKDVDDKTMQDLAEQAKRIQRIAVDPAPDFDHKLLEENEKNLYEVACDGGERLRLLVEQKDWRRALQEVVAWLPVIDTYFVDILVNHEDDGIRRNRHAMLQSILDAMTTVADFTSIEKREVE